MNAFNSKVAMSDPAVKFGWNNHDNPPKNFQFVVDESNVGDVFELRTKDGNVKSLSSLEEVQKELEEDDSDIVVFRNEVIETLLEKAFGEERDLDRKNLKTPGLVVVDIKNTLNLGQMTQTFSTLFKNMLEVLDLGLPHCSSVYYEQDGLNNANQLNGVFPSGYGDGNHYNRKPNQRTTSLHWDISFDDLGVDLEGGPDYLSLGHGKRINLTDDSAISLYCDFAQWYEDKRSEGKYKRKFEKLSHKQIAQLLNAHSKELEEKYTIAIPANSASIRFTFLNQNPTNRGLLHGVTSPVKVDEDIEASRELFKFLVE